MNIDPLILLTEMGTMEPSDILRKHEYESLFSKDDKDDSILRYLYVLYLYIPQIEPTSLVYSYFSFLLNISYAVILLFAST